MEMKNVGSTSHTDVVLCYMEDRVDSGFLQQIEKRLEQIRTDALAMNQESLAECLYHISGTIHFRNLNIRSVRIRQQLRSWMGKLCF